MIEEYVENVEGNSADEIMPEAENNSTEETVAPNGEDFSEEYEEHSEDVDYGNLIEEDLRALRKAFPELRDIEDITELENATRYGALRDLGLTPEEAYRATSKSRIAKMDTRAHLKSSAPRHALSPNAAMSYRDMEIARSLFSDMSDSEIQRLYKKVTK